MRISLGERVAPALALGFAVAFAPAAAEWAVGDTQVSISLEVHFLAVGMTALVAAAASVALTLMGARLADTRTVLLRSESGTAFDARCVTALEQVLVHESGVQKRREAPASRPVVAPEAVPASVWR